VSELERSIESSWFRAIAALVGSALILLLVSLVYTKFSAPTSASISQAQTIPGRALGARMGAASVQGETLVITRPAIHQGQEHSLVSAFTKFTADDYPFLRYAIDGLRAGQRLNLIWRTARKPEEPFRTPLSHNRGRVSTFKLSNDPNWYGTITEIGVHIAGDLSDEPIRVQMLSLEPSSWGRWLAALWSEWSSFKGWSQRSINYVKGDPRPFGTEILSPVVAMAAWAGIALLILYIWDRLQGLYRPVGYALAVFVPVIALDLLWQRELSTQLGETRRLFADGTMHEKRMADYDSDLYSYATRLKSGSLHVEPARIFLLHDSDGLNHDRLKAQYHLLPHNVYNYGRYPVPAATRPGDYILSLGAIPDLSYDAARGRLNWGGNLNLPVELVDRDGERLLFRALPGDGG
jgi:hypothetical protein